MLYKSNGRLQYSYNESYGYRLVVNIDQQIVDYYISLIPKYYRVNRQRYGAHISVVRKEVPPALNKWGKYEGYEVEFFYDNEIKNGTVYYWLNAFSVKLEDIRRELGLPVSSQYTRPPSDEFIKCFHLTLGNVKDI